MASPRMAFRVATACAVALLAAGVFATVGHSRSAMTFRCDRCHTGTAAFSIDVTETSSDTSTVSYRVTTNPSRVSWVVFDGTRRVAGTFAGSGQFTVGRGRPYDVIAVGPLLATGHAAVRVTPPALADSSVSTATADAVAPTTSTDARPAYGGPAILSLTARDDEGGWGVGYVYHRLDGGSVRMTTLLPGQSTHRITLPAIAPPASGKATHRLEYWSQDNYGNVERPNTVTFTVQRPTLTIRPSAASVKAGSGITLSGALSPGTGSDSVRVYVKRPGASAYTLLTTARAVPNPAAPNDARWSVSTKALRGSAFYYAANGTTKSPTVRVEGR